MSSSAFVRSANFVMSEKVEGGLSLDPNDRGNWTSGKVGEGELKGTKYGISAMQYPQLDIASLTVPQARDIYERDYWDEYKLDQLPPRLALCVFDALVNMRPNDAIEALQLALKVEADGILGPVTIRAAKLMDQNDSCARFLAQRALKYISFQKFKDYGNGWLIRCMRAAMEVGR